MTAEDIDRIIQMAWEDRTPFEAIKAQFGLGEAEVIKLMRKEMKRKEFRNVAQACFGKKTKHAQLREEDVERFRCARQKAISHNKISKR